MLAREEYIGVTIKGFHFHRVKNASHVPSMNKYIGKPGEIIRISTSGKTYRVRFKDGAKYSYPADKIHEMFPQTSIDLKSLFNEIQKL
jgi:hypothetical protein